MAPPPRFHWLVMRLLSAVHAHCPAADVVLMATPYLEWSWGRKRRARTVGHARAARHRLPPRTCVYLKGSASPLALRHARLFTLMESHANCGRQYVSTARAAGGRREERQGSSTSLLLPAGPPSPAEARTH